MDHIFWFGDLNYRVNGTRSMVDKLLEQDRVEVLMNNDQLLIEMQKGSVFPHFQEAAIHFPPTYKFDVHRRHLAGQGQSHMYDTSSKARIPSWTDRILVKAKLDVASPEEHVRVEVEKYESCQEVIFSDHKPVFGSFILPL